MAHRALRLHFGFQSLRIVSTYLRIGRILHTRPQYCAPNFTTMAETSCVSTSNAHLESIDPRSLSETLLLVALRVHARECNQLLKRLKKEKLIFDRKNIRPVILDPHPPGSSDGAAASSSNKKRSHDEMQNSKPPTRLILLHESISDLNLSQVDEATAVWLRNSSIDIVQHEIEYKYEHMNVDEVLKRLLPHELEVQTSFETVGHIAHMNLKEEVMPYKHLIGQVILDKNPKLRTVVTKVGQIDTVFRTFAMDVIAGEDDLDVVVKENNAQFRFNFARVYWNSRLQHEHERVVKAIPTGSTVADMFAGVGPFAVPLALQGSEVYANDLNPNSYEALTANVTRNDVTQKVHCYNLDARAFIQQLVQDGVQFQYVCMNLPASAVEFLDAFLRLFDKSQWPKLPFIYVYTFSKAETEQACIADVQARIETLLGPVPGMTFHNVRDVAPRKRMICAQFSLPESCYRTTDEEV